MERFFNGRSDSRRTLRSVAALLHITPDVLLNHARPANPLAIAARACRPLSDPESAGALDSALASNGDSSVLAADALLSPSFLD